MKKIFTLLVLMLAVVGVQAEDFTFTFTGTPTTSGGASWNSESKTVTFTNGESGTITFSLGDNNVDAYNYIETVISSLSGGSIRIYLVGEKNVYNLNNGNMYAMFGGSGTKYLYTNAVESIGHIQSIRMQNYDKKPVVCSMTSITFKDVDAYNTNTIDFNKLPRANSWPNTLVTLPETLGDTETSILFVGTDGWGSNAFINNYHAIYFNVSAFTKAGGPLRAFVNKHKSTQKTYQARLTTDDLADKYDWTTSYNIANTGLHYVDVTAIDTLCGLKTTTLGTQDVRFTVDKIYLAKTHFMLTDGKDLGTIVADPIGATVSYDRTFTIGNKYTVCLPFGLSSTEASEAGKFYELNTTDGTVLKFTEVSEPAAYTPYVFVPAQANPFAGLTKRDIVAKPASASGYAVTPDGSDFTFQGTLAKIDDVRQDGKTIYGYSDNEFVKVTGAVSINAFRAYIIGPSGVTPARLTASFSDDETTGIETVKQAQTESNVMYNLAGQRVAKGHKGLVIKNGRKVVIK